MNDRWILAVLLFFAVVIYVDGAACGNGVLEEGETCDLNKLNSQNCTNFNYTGGSLSCLDDCSGYNYNQCTGDEACGNGIIRDSELCEPGNVRGRTCEDEGYEGGTLTCSSNCAKYDYKGCTGNKSICSDGIIAGKEECDKYNLNNKSCSDVGFDFGVLKCNNNCTLNVEYCFNENTEENLTLNEENNISEELNINEEIPSGVKGVASENKFDIGLSLGNILIVFIGGLAIGVAFIWLYIFKIKK